MSNRKVPKSVIAKGWFSKSLAEKIWQADQEELKSRKIDVEKELEKRQFYIAKQVLKTLSDKEQQEYKGLLLEVEAVGAENSKELQKIYERREIDPSFSTKDIARVRLAILLDDLNLAFTHSQADQEAEKVHIFESLLNHILTDNLMIIKKETPKTSKRENSHYFHIEIMRYCFTEKKDALELLNIIKSDLLKDKVIMLDFPSCGLFKNNDIEREIKDFIDQNREERGWRWDEYMD